MTRATLQKREYAGCNGKTYAQFRMNVPSWIVEKLGWSGQKEIELAIKKGNLVAKKPKKKSAP